MEEETVTLSRTEYDRMYKRLIWLQCLEDAGVDNWQGMEYAQELFNEEYGEEE